MEKVYIAKKEEAIKVVDNEEVKRKGEAKYFSADTFGVEGEVVLIVRGPEEIFSMDIFKGLKEVEGEEKERIMKKLKEMEESAASGVGLIFG